MYCLGCLWECPSLLTFLVDWLDRRYIGTNSATSISLLGPFLTLTSAECYSVMAVPNKPT